MVCIHCRVWLFLCSVSHIISLFSIPSFNTYYIISVQAFSRCPLPIPCSTFNSDGSIFAYAVSPKRYHISHRVFDQLSFEIYLLLV